VSLFFVFLLFVCKFEQMEEKFFLSTSDYIHQTEE